MALSLDFLGFGSKRKTAFRVLDAAWDAADIDVRAIDNGVRLLLFQWAEETAASPDNVDTRLQDFAAFTGFLMRGPELSQRALGPDGVATMERRLDAALDDDSAGRSDAIDVRLIKLVLAASLADRDIEAVVGLEDEPGTGG